jgi:integrase
MHRVLRKALKQAVLWRKLGNIPADAVQSPKTERKQMKALDADGNLQRVRLHDLRHTHATQMLKNGVHPKIAQERLGHPSIAITLALYSHVLPGMQDEAAEGLDRALRAAIERIGKAKG